MIVTLAGGICVGLRPAEASDWPFVFNSWMRQVRALRPFDRFDQNEFAAHKVMVVDPIARSSRCLIAHDADDPVHIYGYVVWQPDDVMHAIYVKGLMRGYGIARKLLEEAFGTLGERAIYATYWGKSLPMLAEKYRVKYDPYRVVEAFS